MELRRPSQPSKVKTTIENSGVGMTVFFDKIVNAMHVQRNWLLAMFCRIGDAGIATNTFWTVSFINSEAMRLTGWTRGNALGKLKHRVLSIASEDACSPFDIGASRAMRIEAGAQTSPRELLIAKDHSALPIERTFSPSWDAKGEIVGTAVVFRIATACKQSQLDERHDLRGLHTEVVLPVILGGRLISMLGTSIACASRRVPLARWLHQIRNIVNRAKNADPRLTQDSPRTAAFVVVECAGPINAFANSVAPLRSR
jgi:hypothetical protein